MKHSSNSDKKLIAWGSGTLLYNYLHSGQAGGKISYVVDSFQETETDYEGIPFLPAKRVMEENLANTLIVIFCVSNNGSRAIAKMLNSWGLEYRKNYIDCSELFRHPFTEKLSEALEAPVHEEYHSVALSHYNNSHVPVQTTVCGCWTMLEVAQATKHLSGPIAEVGAYRGGNAVLLLQAMALRDDRRKYFILDSYAGFPEMSSQDPHHLQKAFNEEYNFHEIVDRFAVYPQSEIIRGFVPETFKRLPQNEKFSLVFFDCDLYQPTKDTLEFFWERMQPGAFFVFHDYESKAYSGVKAALDEFCAVKKLQAHVFYESTMAVLRYQ